MFRTDYSSRAISLANERSHRQWQCWAYDREIDALVLTTGPYGESISYLILWKPAYVRMDCLSWGTGVRFLLGEAAVQAQAYPVPEPFHTAAYERLGVVHGQVVCFFAGERLEFHGARS